MDPTTGYLTYAGFQQTFVSPLVNGSSDFVWRSLQSFNYTLAIPAGGTLLELTLVTPPEFTDVHRLDAESSLRFAADAADSVDSFLTRLFRAYMRGACVCAASPPATWCLIALTPTRPLLPRPPLQSRC